MVIKLYWGKFLQVDHATSPGQFFVTRMLTRDLFAVANLLVLYCALRENAEFMAINI